MLLFLHHYTFNFLFISVLFWVICEEETEKIFSLHKNLNLHKEREKNERTNIEGKGKEGD